MNTKKKKINWLNTLYLTINPIIAITATIILAFNSMIHWQTIVLTIALAIICSISITAGYHRLFSHLTYKTVWPIRLIFLLFGAATFEGSALDWCTDHRNHHLYTDTERDPYNFKQGFWYAHIGWLFTLDPSKRDFSNVEDLQKDPLVRFQDKFYIPIAIVIGYFLPLVISLAWGDWLGGLFVAGALRITFSQQTTFFINSICHKFGKLTYSDKCTARDNWLTALFTFGEGYHNFHHKFPLDYRNAIRYYQFDPTKWLIKSLSYIGLTKDLKKISDQKILEYKLLMDKKRLNQESEKLSALSENSKDMLHNLYDNITQLISKTDHLEKAYRKLKAAKLSDLQVRADEYKLLLKKHHHEIKILKSKLKVLTKAWKCLVTDALMQGHYAQ